MTPLTDAPDFEPALDDLQDHLPDWWRTQDPTSQIYALLTGIGSTIDLLSPLWEAPYLDQVLTTASAAGVMRNFQLAWGLTNEQVSSVQALLVAYIQLLASDDGSLQAATSALAALLTAPTGATLGSPEANGVPDPSFEYDTVGDAPVVGASTAPGWFLAAGATVEVVASNAESGSNALKVTTTSSPSEQGYAQPLGVLPTGTYTASMYVQGAAGGEQLRLFAGIISPGTGDGNLSFPATTAMVRYSVTFTSDGATASYIGIRTNTAAAVTIYLDDLSVTAGGELLAYGDGDSPGWYWTGTPGDSPSAQHGLTYPVLTFPPDGSGLRFPADGSGLTFGVFQLLYIEMDYLAYTMTVYVLDWLQYDAPTFAREVQRFVPADWNGATVVPVAILPWTITQLEGTYLTVTDVETVFATVTDVEDDVT